MSEVGSKTVFLTHKEIMMASYVSLTGG